MSLESFFKTNMSIELKKRVQLDGKLWERVGDNYKYLWHVAAQLVVLVLFIG